jgi:hypothetical protein
METNKVKYKGMYTCNFMLCLKVLEYESKLETQYLYSFSTVIYDHLITLYYNYDDIMMIMMMMMMMMMMMVFTTTITNL